MIKIYGTNTSPFTRKVRVVAIEKKIDFSFERFESTDTHKFYLNGKNPLGKIPFLIKDKAIIFDSPVIAEYLDGLSPNKILVLSQNQHDKINLRRWEALADGISDIAINSIVYERRRQPDKVDENKINNSLNDVKASLELASVELGNNNYCVGKSISIADISLLCTLDFLKFRLPDIQWQKQFPNLQKHHEKMYHLSSIQKTSPFI